ncbi:MAG TPA: hypothetical protein VEY12_12970 [Thermoplasmata archaeon]|nr:hypothetical protein [Thermoplasmata archaeon]
MVSEGLRSRRSLRALVLATVVGSLLAWLYIAARIVVNGIDPPDPFLPGVPSLSFIRAGALSFGLFCLSLFLYLWLWGRFDGTPALPQSFDGREP